MVAARGAIAVRVEEPATISVTDDGPGIPPADRERVFEPFYRLHGGSRGAGLGLNLVQEIVRLHAGQVADIGRSKRRHLRQNDVQAGVQPAS